MNENWRSLAAGVVIILVPPIVMVIVALLVPLLHPIFGISR